MTDYTEVLKDLRYCVSDDSKCSECKRLYTSACQVRLMVEAANAIEELIKEREGNDR